MIHPPVLFAYSRDI